MICICDVTEARRPREPRERERKQTQPRANGCSVQTICSASTLSHLALDDKYTSAQGNILHHFPAHHSDPSGNKYYQCRERRGEEKACRERAVFGHRETCAVQFDRNCRNHRPMQRLSPAQLDPFRRWPNEIEHMFGRSDLWLHCFTSLRSALKWNCLVFERFPSPFSDETVRAPLFFPLQLQCESAHSQSKIINFINGGAGGASKKAKRFDMELYMGNYSERKF